MSRATNRRTDEGVNRIERQLVQLLERASRRRSMGDLPGLPGAKRPEEEILVLA